MAKKRQLNVRLSDALLDRLEERVQKTKMGMAAMVEILLTHALQQDMATPLAQPEDRYDELLKRIEAIEAKLADGDRFLQEEISSTEVEVAIASPSIEDVATENKSANESEKEIPLKKISPIDALSLEELVNRLKVEVRTLNQKKDKSTFSAWAKKHDPEGIAWQYNDVEDCFYPLAV
ncbi:hypothetical protein [Pseudanabaena sp. 'Roaring Creek']|uniref:hypothetical protein n=1 Tax=Pseudanabaena sp. 'Roaring Creek' TaxID=1681830 RepID=UPI0006D829C3|nr:hypothetical protein [Pseudanabaena sp. 'Roaring Creek']